ncbi:MAG: hypothetical protein AB7I36_20385 [Rhodospirillaceae bacterium]
MSDRVFERAALPYLRLAFPGVVSTPSRRRFDSSGIDHLVWSDTQPLPLVVQCKGFEVNEWEIGVAQANQCIASIRSFRDSSLSASTYLVVHNRTNKDPEFRALVQTELQDLVARGIASRAELWDADRLVGAALDSMFARLQRLAHEGTLSVVKDYAASEPDLCPPLLEVPLRTSLMTASQYKLETERDVREIDADPARLLLESEAHFTVLVGYAGFGKTTATLRVATSTGNRTFFSPAARIDRITTKAMLARCVDLDRLLADTAPEDMLVAERAATLAVDRFFKLDDGSFLLLIDALDEAAPLARRGGLQEFFNGLREVRSRVAVTVRKEFFEARTSDFAASFGFVSDREHRVHNQTIQVIELLPWSDEHILRLVRRYSESVADAGSRARLQELIGAVESGRYMSFYGDIPRRPLFLRFILETVSSSGIRQVSRSNLFQEWARLKVVRDVSAPPKAGGLRAPIADEAALDDTVDLAFEVMASAARSMTAIVDGRLELLSDCVLADALTSSRLQSATLEGVVLNSLLVPVGMRQAPDPIRVRFAHRAFQEFFLARFIHANPHFFAGVAIPDDVSSWLGGLQP